MRLLLFLFCTLSTGLFGKVSGVLWQDNGSFIQKVQLKGRLHWQYASVVGSWKGKDFDYDTEEVRRLRLSPSIGFGSIFTLSTSIDMERDKAFQGKTRQLGYAGLYFSKLDIDIATLLELDSLDKLSLSLGKSIVYATQEYAISSRFIKTAERSSLTNLLTPPSSTGVRLFLKKKKWSGSLGIFSQERSSEFAPFLGSHGFFGSVMLGYDCHHFCEADKASVHWRCLFADRSASPFTRDALSFSLLNTLSFQYQKNRFSLLVEGSFGEHRESYNAQGERFAAREGAVWGMIIQPAYVLVNERLEAVLSYQYARSSREEGLRLSSRYLRYAGANEAIDGLSGGYGEEHHSLYVGVTYFLAKEQAKIMAGFQYDHLASRGKGLLDARSCWLACRFYF